MAVEARADDHRMLALLAAIDDSDTRYEATAERAFLAELGGGCSVPVGAYAQCIDDEMLMTVYISSEDGENSFTTKVQGPKADALGIARAAFHTLEREGGADLVAAARANLA